LREENKVAAPAPRPGDLIVGINVTPLVDVVLVLLIVLMVSASYTVSKGLPVELPKAQTGEAAQNSPLAITIDARGALYLDGSELSRDALRDRVRQLRAKSSTSAVIAADGATAHRAVVGVIDLLRVEGITQFAINVAQEDLLP
jgi:biopolymer transport protein ExbD